MGGCMSDQNRWKQSEHQQHSRKQNKTSMRNQSTNINNLQIENHPVQNLPKIEQNNAVNPMQSMNINIEQDIRRNEHLPTIQEMSQAVQQLERSVHNPQQSQNTIQIVYNIQRIDLLFFLYQNLITQDMSQVQRFLLFNRILQLLSSQPQNQGLTQEQINKIDRSTSALGDKHCAVCQEPTQKGDEILILQCKHQYHSQCIIPWLQKSDKCPQCRKSVRKPESN